MAVPLLDLTRQNSALHAALTEAFERVLRSGHFIMGPEVDAFEKECAAHLGATHAVSVSSGTDALLLSLMALDIGPGDEVICPSFTFFATAGSIARLGAIPVFADVDPISFNLDPQDVQRRITPRTKAIMPVHLFGQAAEMSPLLELAQAHRLRVIEDAAQAFGARLGERCCGTLGDLGTFSFFPSKNLGGFGDGGLVTTQDDSLADRLRLLRTHGSRPKYYHREVGGNFRMDALQCALLRVKLPHLEAYTEARRSHARRHSSALAALPGVHPAQLATPDSRIVLPLELEGRRHIWNQFTLRVRGAGRRDSLRDHLAARRIGTEIYYPLPLHLQQCFSQLPKVSIPVTEALSQEVLSIPVFPELTLPETEELAQAIKEWLS